MHYEYTLSIDGTTLVAEVRWYVSAVAVSPFHTDQLRFELTDHTTSVARITQVFRDRAAVVKRGLTTYQEINTALGAGQNVRAQVVL